MSIILRPRRRANHLTLTPLIASLAITEALEEYGVNGRIKWPNDVVVNGRKIAGILCESSIAAGRFQWVIVGIGVNANNPPPILTTTKSSYQATSMIQVTGEETNLESLANSLRDLVIQHYDDLLSGGERAMLTEYNAHQMLRDRKLRVSLHDQILEGVAGQVDSEGRLGLQGPDGSTHKIRSEDVLLVETLDESALRNSL